ncbi:MAG TPA: universal stress protein [Kofleriaceae bacterium]
MLIIHASDFTGDDAAASLHAAALASRGARLITLHTGPARPVGHDEHEPSPGATELAARWGRTIDHELVQIASLADEISDGIADSLIEALRELRPELIVVGTHARRGIAAWIRSSISEAIARNVAVPVLVVPNRARGFVDPRDGTVDLRRIVVPADHAEAARRGAEAARWLAQLAGHAARAEDELVIVHAGAPDPDLHRLGIPVLGIEGVLEDAIAEAARGRDACLIAMATRGHDGIGDVFRGSHTERVIREASCPVLSVPI